jgi:N-glycosylase/DNA lyase
MNLAGRISTYQLEEAVKATCDRIEEKHIPNIKWTNFTEDNLWHELVSCILGSRVQYELAKACTTQLIHKGLTNPKNIEKHPKKAAEDIASELSSFTPFSNFNTRYPFPKSKAEYIVHTGSSIYGKNNDSLQNILKKSTSEHEAREILVKKAKGIGYKQASLFLRNIGYANNLAILDVHVINFMYRIGLVDARTLNISYKKNYFKTENKMQDYAKSIKRKISKLDMAIWVVMRTIKKEGMTSSHPIKIGGIRYG